MIITDSCYGCENKVEVLVSAKFNYAYKIGGCRRITERLYEPVLAHRSARDACESLCRDHDNIGFFVPDKIEKSSPETLFPEIIETGMWVEYLPVEERYA